MKTLIAFSGLDSCWLAFRILKETDDELVAFWMDLSHIFYVGKDGELKRHSNDLLPAEKLIAPKVVAWLSKNVRPVTFQVVEGVKPDPLATQVPGATARSWRVIPMLRCAADLCAKGKFDRFVYGRSPENIRTPGQEMRAQWFQGFWKSIAPAGVTFEMPLIKDWQGRPHAIAGLPKELLDIVLTCNDPKPEGTGFVDCGVCEKCVLTQTSLQLLAGGMSPDKALDYILKKRKAGPYIDAKSGGDDRFGADRIPTRFPKFDEKDLAELANNPIQDEALALDKT